MSTDINNPYNIAGKPIQGGIPADLQFIRFNFANNQWEYVLAGAGEVNLGANVGVGVGLVFRDKTGVTLNFKTLIQGTNITITNNANDITIDGPVPGEVNLGANVGSGVGLLFRDKTGVTLNIKRLIQGAGITLTNGADDVTIAAAAGAVLWEVLGDYEAGIAEASHVFSFTAVDFDDDSKIVVVIDGTPTDALALQMRINTLATTVYFSDGRRITGGVETLIDINSANELQLGSSALINGGNNPFTGEAIIFLNKAGTQDRPAVISSFSSSGSLGGEVYASMVNSNEVSITDVEIRTSTSTWKIGTRITVYKVARA